MGQFLIIIYNPPYSNEVITDNKMPDLNGYAIHHYFVARCIRLLKEHGILAFVLPSYYMDIPRKNTRAIIDNEAVLIDAVRLPENLFTQATVTVDILFIRKTGNKVHNFVNTVPIKQGSKQERINEYWKIRPQRILGELQLKWVNYYKRYVPSCITSDINHVFASLTNCRFTQTTKQNYQLIAGVC